MKSFPFTAGLGKDAVVQILAVLTFWPTIECSTSGIDNFFPLISIVDIVA